MAVFELKEKGIVGLEAITFARAGIREREDLQRLLRDHIGVISPDTLVISEEFSEWEDSDRRIDLLAVDRSANLVVIELKRDEVGAHMELQALRYAAMASTLTFARALSFYEEYLVRTGSDLDPEDTLLSFFGWDEADEEKFGQRVRVVLASADFSKEITTTVLWLNEHELDIRCVRLKPYRADQRIFLDVQQVVPLPEATEFQVHIKEKNRAERVARESSRDLMRYNVTVGEDVQADLPKRHAIWRVVKGLVDGGVSPEQIERIIDWKQRLFRVVDGQPDEGTVAEILTAQMQADEVVPNLKRWFYRDGQRFIFPGRTYVFTTQWGRRTEEAMRLLIEAFPGNSISFLAHGEDDGEERP